ncbi:MAG: hypothetical protein ACK40M_08645 [Flavobacteriales bacterium]
MKKLLSTLVFVLIATFGFSQNLTATGGSAALGKAKASTGVFEFTATGLDIASINQNAKTYASWFTVAAKEGKGSISLSITMHKNESQTRRVMHRYFVTLNVQTVTVDSTEMKVEDFVEKYLI